MIQKETNAARLKRLRAAAKLEGLCYVCRFRKPRNENSTCDHCIALGKAHKKTRTARGACAGCARPRRPGRTYCIRCAKKHRMTERLRVAGIVASGCCARCQLVRDVTNRVLCSKCLDVMRLEQVDRSARNGAQPDGRKCTVCGETGHNRRFHDRVFG